MLSGGFRDSAGYGWRFQGRTRSGSFIRPQMHPYIHPYKHKCVYNIYRHTSHNLVASLKPYFSILSLFKIPKKNWTHTICICILPEPQDLFEQREKERPSNHKKFFYYSTNKCLLLSPLIVISMKLCNYVLFFTVRGAVRVKMNRQTASFHIE